ncbi:DUF2577 domain-containing protein [Paenibacillus guangzhouensis]|uniref:DUF2577 domain-containing protein n=1 Tax=Paenibacillus guangzhouensis TaxID=1473112 RepID=UPI001D117BD3
MSIADKIRQLGIDAISAGNPVAVLFGKVSKINPLEVIVDQRFTLDEDFLIITEQLTRYEVDLELAYVNMSGNTQTETQQSMKNIVIIREGLKVGDVVILLRIQGGQKYVVWDKVVTT